MRASFLYTALAVYALMSAVTFGFYWMDKRRARGGRWRVPEATLHILALLGGWPGALIAVRWLRHKNRKLAFLITLWVTVALHAVVWALMYIR
jgi:uncharacterized membrane protein YsdA (DUF1294 family)